MARHRNIRKLDFEDGEYVGPIDYFNREAVCYSIEYGYDDVYGRSLEDEPAVSPSTAGKLPAYLYALATSTEEFMNDVLL